MSLLRPFLIGETSAAPFLPTCSGNKESSSWFYGSISKNGAAGEDSLSPEQAGKNGAAGVTSIINRSPRVQFPCMKEEFNSRV